MTDNTVFIDDSTVKNMPRFDGKHAEFSQWKQRVLITAHKDKNNTWGKIGRIIDGEERPTNNQTAEATWDNANESLFNLLFLLTRGDALALVNRHKPVENLHNGDGIGAWRDMLHKFEGKSMERSIELGRELYSFRMIPNEDPDHFFSRLLGLRDQLRSVGQVIEDQSLCSLIIDRVPSEYDEVRRIHYHTNAITLEQIKDTMRKV